MGYARVKIKTSTKTDKFLMFLPIVIHNFPFNLQKPKLFTQHLLKMSDLSRELFFQLVDVTGEINGQKCCVLTNTIQMEIASLIYQLLMSQL